MSNKQKNYFEYCGKKYYEGTIVEFKNDNRYKYGEYDGVEDLFTSMISPTEYEANGRVKLLGHNHEIKRIVKAIDSASKVEYIKAYKDTDCNDMFYAWILYIVTMLFVSITTSRIIGWIGITLYFIYYRHNKLYVSKRSYEDKQRTGGI